MECYAFQMTGLAHAAMGRELEDRLCCGRSSEHALWACVADGMGSCWPHAAEAAELSCASAASVVGSSSPGRSDDRGAECAMQASTLAALSCADAALRRHARERGHALDELGTTLMVVQYDELSRTLWYAYSGDGGILVLGADRSVRLVVEPQAYGGGVTHAVTSSEWWRVGAEAGVDAFLVCTDGLLEALLEDGAPGGLARDILLMGPGGDALLDRMLSSAGEVGELALPTAEVGDDRTLLACWSQGLVDELGRARAQGCASMRCARGCEDGF